MVNEERKAFAGIILAIFLAGSMGCALAEEAPVVNLMLDADVTPAPTDDEKQIAGEYLINLVNEIDPQGWNATIYVSGSMASAYRLGITLQGTMPNHELALYGNATDEKLSSLSENDQEALLTQARDVLYSCYVCGGKHVDIKGFRPQGFDQNEKTLEILGKLGVIYNAGFQSGLIYMPGHEKDVWPYPIDSYNLYAVPVSTYSLSGEGIYLYDRYVRDEKKLSSSQWYEILVKKFDESAEKGEPMVVIFSNLVSGTGDYLDAYRKFLGYASSKGATFVTTMQLVEMAAARQPSTQASAIDLPRSNGTLVNASERGVLSDCPTCYGAKEGTSDSIIDVTIQKSQKCLTCNQSSDNSTST